MALSPVVNQSYGLLAPTIEVGFTLHITKRTPDVTRCHYHVALDILMRALLNCFGSAHAEGTHQKDKTIISTCVNDLPTDAQFRQLEQAARRINADFCCLHVDML